MRRGKGHGWPHGFYMFYPTVHWGLKRSHTVSCSSILVGGQGGPSYSPSGRWHFPPFRHPDGCPLKELCSRTPEMSGESPFSWDVFFEDEYSFILKAFTYLEVNAKATDDFQINISIPWNSQKNKHILSVLRGAQ